MDFSLIFAKLNAKYTSAKMAEMQASGVLPLTADVVITFPPTLMAGLIRALNVQKESFEQVTETELKELSDEPAGEG